MPATDLKGSFREFGSLVIPKAKVYYKRTSKTIKGTKKRVERKKFRFGESNLFMEGFGGIDGF